MCQTVARRCNIEDECTGRFFEDRFDSNKLEDEADVLACMAYVDLNPIRSGMVDSLDAADANVSIAERLRGLDGEPVDSASWLAPLELASEVDKDHRGHAQPDHQGSPGTRTAPSSGVHRRTPENVPDTHACPLVQQTLLPGRASEEA